MAEPLITPINSHQTVPFHRATLGEAEVAAVAAVIRSGWLTMGPQTLEFERQFAQYVGSRFAIAVSSGTAALHLALEAAGIGSGDEVLVPTTTFTATAEVVVHLGARPVLVDVEPSTMTISTEDAAARITAKTRAILPVHFAGQPCHMTQLLALASNHNLKVIEDAAHALPSSYRGRRIGSLGEFSAFSFYATKTLTTGEGGMITTNNESHAQRMRLMRLHGIAPNSWEREAAPSWYYQVREAGYKCNLNDLQAAIGLVQLAKCEEMYQARCRIAKIYSREFEGNGTLEVPAELSDRQTSSHLYVLRLNLEYLRIDRDRFIHELSERGIGTGVHFIPLHLHPCYRERFHYKTGDFPTAENEYRRCISLPIFPSMTDEEIERVVATVLGMAKEWRK